jgi:hypothetical protein
MSEMKCGSLITSVTSPEVSHWNIDLLHQKWQGNVLVVWSPHDELFTVDHVKKFQTHFAQHKKSTFAHHVLTISDFGMNYISHHHSQSPLVDITWIYKIV